MNKYLIFTILISCFFNLVEAQNFYLYGNMSANDKNKLKSIINNLINDNKNKPLKKVNFFCLNYNNANPLKYKNLSASNLDNVINNIAQNLRINKPEKNEFKDNLDKALIKKEYLYIYDLNNIPNKINISVEKKNINRLNIGLNFFKHPIKFEYHNITSKYEISTPRKTIKLKYDNQNITIDKVLLKFDNQWTEIDNFFSEDEYITFQITKFNSKAFSLNTRLISNEGDTSEVKTISNLKFSKLKQNNFAEISGITLETPGIIRCKKLTGIKKGTYHYYVKIIADKDFDIHQLDINLRITEKDMAADYNLALRKIKPEDLSMLNMNNNKVLFCLFIDPALWLPPYGDCTCDDYGQNAKYEVWLDNNSEYLSYFEPNEINNNKIPAICQGFKRSDEEFKILPKCDCK